MAPGYLAALWILLLLSAFHVAVLEPGQDAEELERNHFEWDENGYVLYCPCMGRFGNQAAHFLGALAFAKHLNRTLALPPWRCYVRQRNVPFTDWFQVAPIQSYHKAILLQDFLQHLAPSKWPPGQRRGYCYRPSNSEKESCEMKKGNPFGPFWEELGVEFDDSVFMKMSYDVEKDYVRKMWRESFPPQEHPVLAFKGAPASFPVQRSHRSLQSYLQWSDRMRGQADEYINNTIGTATYIGIHLRMGKDWERACEHATGRESFMESGQCLESLPPRTTITKGLCIPPLDLVSRHVLTIARKNGIKDVFVASDVAADVHNMKQRLGISMRVHHLSPDLPQLDLLVLGRADYFIGNCVSSFTAFVKRERDARGAESQFFLLQELRSDTLKKQRTEL